MGLILPTVSTSTSYGTYAQDWAGNFNYNFFTIDSHNHTEGNGTQIASSNLLSGELNLNSYGVNNVSYLTFQSNTDSNVDSNSAYSDSNGYLYWKNSDGQTVQITDGSGIVPLSGDLGFTGDYGTDGSRAVYYTDADAFYFYGANGLDLTTISAKQIV